MEIVLRSMRKTINKSKFIDGGNAEEIYRSMLDGVRKNNGSTGYQRSGIGDRKTALQNLENNTIQNESSAKSRV